MTLSNLQHQIITTIRGTVWQKEATALLIRHVGFLGHVFGDTAKENTRRSNPL